MFSPSKPLERLFVNAGILIIFWAINCIMKNARALFVSLLSTITLIAYGQTPSVEILTSGTKTSLRGLSVVNENIIWVSGSNGSVGKSVNGGKSWSWMKVNGFEKSEFRDIEGFNGNVAVILAIGEPAHILKTTDGGQSWKVVYENKTKGMFLDAMDFADNQKGMIIGDPINGKVFIATTEDSGNTWQEYSNPPAADSGEAFFAASGTNLRYFGKDDFYLVSGGTKSRLMTGKTTTSLDLLQGLESTGANSIDLYDPTGKRIIIVGGDFAKDSITGGNCLYTTNGGKTWKKPEVPPHGYRSCVEYLSKKALLACGINGVDYSSNGGRTWTWISKEGFNVCRIARVGSAVYLAGNNGKIARLTWSK